MTIKELKDVLGNYPEDAIVMYWHNKYGRVDVDSINYTEEDLLSGKKLKCLTLEASFEED